MSTRISVAIITLNEEKNIERCLKSVSFADEIVVVDSGSQDRTVELAKAMGAKVTYQPWLGFGAQKQKAVDLCRNDWILSMDADEALDEEAQTFVRSFGHRSEFPEKACRFARSSFHMGRWIKHGGWSPDYQLRLFDRTQFRWTPDRIHEKVDGPKNLIGTASGKILHWVFRDLSHQIETNNRYSTLGAEALFEKGKRFSLLKLIFKPWSKFMETYIVKGGFMDGLPGFIISVGAAYSVFLKFSKLWELERRGKR